jgi:uncharacterized protein YceK
MKRIHIKNITTTAILAASCIWLSGCASIITSGDRKIQVTSHPDAATITVYDMNQNVVASGLAPTKIKLKKGAGYFQGADYRMVIAKPGYQSREIEIRHNINGWYFGNFFIGGLLGLVVVDPLTGGMWTLEPGKVDVELTSSATSSDATIPIVTPDQLTPAQRARLVPLNVVSMQGVGR